MRRTDGWRRYLSFIGPSVETDVGDELQFHLDTKIEELKKSGWQPDQARREAARQFGNVAQYRTLCEQIDKEHLKKMERADYFAGWKQDIVYASRQLRKSIGSTVSATLTLALGIGAVTAIFSVIYAVVLQPLPFPEPDRIVTIWTTRDGKDDVVIPRNFDAWKTQATSFTKLAALEHRGFTLTDGDEPIQVTGARVSSDYFDVFGVSPQIGRTFSPEEDRVGGPRVALISHRLWKQRFDSNPGVLGKDIQLNRLAHTIVGVMPASFDLRPDGEQVWIPLTLRPQAMNWTGGVLYVFGRLQPHSDLRQAQLEMDVLAKNLETLYPDVNQGRGVRVGLFVHDLVGDYRQRLTVLFGAVLFVLLIACANVANLLLARGTARAKELAIRAAHGATGRRLFRQLIVESAMIAAISALMGGALAVAGIQIVQALTPHSVPRIGEAALNGPSLLFALCLGLGTTLLFGALPAWRSLRLDLQSGLREGGRGSEGSVRDWVRTAYVAGEVSLALLLLAGAGLLIRSSIAALQLEPGFTMDNVLTVRTALPRAQYSSAKDIVQAFDKIIEQLVEVPGVTAVSLSSKVPMGPGSAGVVLKPGATSSDSLKSELSAEVRYIGPDYLAALGIPLRKGRDLTGFDDADSRQVVLVNETLARRLWPDSDAVGQSIRIPELNAERPVWEVAGIVGDVREDGLMQPVPGVLFIPFRQVGLSPWQWTQQSAYLIIKTRIPPLDIADQARKAVREVDSMLATGDQQTMEQRFSASIATARLYTILLTSLGAIGLLLTAVGIYGVVAYFVTRQQSELAVRVALGASPRQLMLLVVAQGMKPVAIGVAAGALLAQGLGQSLSSQVFMATAADPATLFAVILILAVVACAACCLPALRAVRVDPMVILRRE